MMSNLSTAAQEELVGTLAKEKILDCFPDWQEKTDSYFPKLDVIGKLQVIDRPLRIEVILGTWCPDSKEHICAFFKIMEMADNPLISVSYIGVPKEKEARKEYIEGKNIIKIPTFIIYFQDQEIGRIIETPKKSLEEDLLDIMLEKRERLEK